MSTACKDCKHFEPARNPDTGRPLRSKDGECVYPVTWPTLPKSYLPDPWHCYGSSRRVQFPQRGKVWGGNTEHCPVFEPKKG